MPSSTDAAKRLEEINNESFKLKFFTDADLKVVEGEKVEGTNTTARRVEKTEEYEKEVEDTVTKLRETLDKIEGVTNVAIDPSTRTATFSYTGTWKETEALQRTIVAKVPAYLLSPAPMYVKLTYPPKCDKKVLAQAIIGTQGVRHAHLLPNGAEVQFDVESGNYDSVLKVFLDSGFQIAAGSSHRLAMFKVKGEGAVDALKTKLDNIKGVLTVKVDEDKTVWLTAYGKSWKDQVDAAVKECGYELDGKMNVK